MRRTLIALRTARTAGATETQARLDALRTVMATLQDTELLYTAGPAGLRHVQAGARTVLETGDTAAPAGAETLTALDADLRARSWSPRGSTGLLAGSLFLDALTSGRRALVPGCRTVGLRGCRPAARLEGVRDGIGAPCGTGRRAGSARGSDTSVGRSRRVGSLDVEQWRS
ncbi:hypothetical protein CFC35_07565 [Streptomyces sp. FBKL.4005]|nr:hypothetical protein CFC35_07565 [Streptomyces sp. FBKL.4005]